MKTEIAHVAAVVERTLRRLVDRVRRRLPTGRGFDAAALQIPPWVARPDWPPNSMGWRMGGEQGYFAVQRMYAALAPAEQAAWERLHPPPPEWEYYLAPFRRG